MRALIIAIACLSVTCLQPLASRAQTSGPVQVESPSLEQMLEALILQRGVDIMVQNIKASERESGDLDKAIRATLGISVADIKKYGLLGGPNSEMRKLFKALGLAQSVGG